VPAARARVRNLWVMDFMNLLFFVFEMIV